MHDGTTAKADPSMSAIDLEVSGLTQQYGRVRALDAVTLAVAAGETLAVMGQNGSGKSTLLRLLAGIERPWRGQVAFGGRSAPWSDPRLRRRVGYLPQTPDLFDQLTVRRQLAAAARLYGVAAAAVARELARCGLTEVADRPTGRLSVGQRRRVALAMCLLHQPELLVLDEPTAGLDPEHQQMLATLLAQLRGEVTIVFATHHAAEALAHADSVLVLHRGRVVERMGLSQWTRSALVQVDTGASLPSLASAARVQPLGNGRYQVELKSDRDGNALAAELGGGDVAVMALTVGPGAAESHLLRLVAEGRP